MGVMVMMAVVAVRSHRIQVTVASAEPSTIFSASCNCFLDTSDRKCESKDRFWNVRIKTLTIPSSRL
jgi:hypothetical protein